MEDVITNPDLPWNYYSVTSNPNTSILFVIYNLHLFRDIPRASISSKTDSTMEIVLKYPDIDWVWSCITVNSATLEDIIAYSVLQNWNAICYNTNITIPFISANINNINLQALSRGIFEKNNVV